jgi:hypothetical protein
MHRVVHVERLINTAGERPPTLESTGRHQHVNDQVSGGNSVSVFNASR